MGEVKRKRDFIADWCERMAAEHGPFVLHDDGRAFTWREALRLEAHPERLKCNACGVPDVSETPTKLEVECAKAWAAGFWPNWARRAERKHG
jgi:hypothetical protein